MAARGLLPNIWSGLKSLLWEELSRTGAELLGGVVSFWAYWITIHLKELVKVMAHFCHDSSAMFINMKICNLFTTE